MSAIRTALARTYRPRRFDEVATQEHVSETLRTAVATNRVGHAYLFCGPRGVGKTTAARVLAMALNCPNRGADGEPCGACDSCERIWSGKTSLDVIEIDAASNRGVDDARELRERAMYAPTDDKRWKVYIVDEAHMLTREAWNALLKILEEPPPRVIFVFATTEPQKIQQQAAPILSRCQRFDFRRIPTQGIVKRLKTVLAEEHVAADEAALTAIARRADGGMRDALSLTDQVLSLAGDRIGPDDVSRVLGFVSDELYLDLFRIVAEHRVGDVFRFVQRVLDDGYDLAEFYRGLAEAVRTLIVAQIDGAESADVREDLRPAYAEVAALFSRGDLIRMLSHIAELDTEGRFRKSANPRTMLEAVLLSWATLDSTIELEALLSGKAPVRAAPEPRTRPAPSTMAAPPAMPPAAPAPAPAPAPVRSGSATDALRNMKAPAGMGFFLRAAEVIEDRAGIVLLEMPAGPGLERMQDAATLRAVEDAMSEALGRVVTVQVRAKGGAQTSHTEKKAAAPAPQRITPERVKLEKVERLAKSDPTVGSAVKEWDLELLD